MTIFTSVVFRIVLVLPMILCLLPLKAQDKLFQALTPEESGIDFMNFVPDTSYMIKNAYMYSVNGGGTAVGDFNNDGLQDVIFSSNYGEIALYENKGNLKFEKKTETGLIADDWCTSLTAGDINGDGLLDLYVCKTAFERSHTGRHNLLFINKGNFKFEEQAKAWGIADDGNSTGASFFDFDHDGDLDLYVVNGPNMNIKRLTFVTYPIHKFYGSDHLYENQGGKMVDVTVDKGIKPENGFGLSVVTVDINMDGWQDIYVANDFLDEDYIYINEGGNKFVYKTKDMLGHTSFFSMGSDINDFNNDGLPDIVSVDMLQEDLRKFKYESTISTYDSYENLLDIGKHNQYIRNCLQLNRGDGTFSEIAELAGVAATDWSWSCLFADFNNDGWKDLFISNGIRYKSNIDYLNYESDSVRAAHNEIEAHSYVPLEGGSFGPSVGGNKINLVNYPKEEIPNYIYENNKDLTFTLRREEWGLDQVVNSNGSAYADLDNDGDLELIVNNHNQVSTIYKNLSVEKSKTRFLRFRVKAQKSNTSALGTKIFVFSSKGIQYQEITCSRGFQSNSESRAHFGMGTEPIEVDSVVAVSPHGDLLVLHPKLNSEHVLDFSLSKSKYNYSKPKLKTIFEDQTLSTGLNFLHKENSHQDFKREPLLPHLFSRSGPGLAVGDVNNDGLDDVFVGGASRQAGQLFLQNKQATFVVDTRQQAWVNHIIQEDMGALFFDVDNDNDLDLYIVSGGNEELIGEDYYKDRLYINDGTGLFSYQKEAINHPESSGSCVVAADYDQDGDLDLFVGGRILTGQYPLHPRSFLLNNQNGKLVDVSLEHASGIDSIGLVTAALWTDIDDDKDLDLLIVGQWMPVVLYMNDKGRLVRNDEYLGLENSSGWWNSVTGADLDDDGDTDYILGNLGLNTRLKASPKEPMSIIAADFDINTSLDAITSVYNMGINQPIHRYPRITDQLLVFRRRFLKVKSYAYADINTVIPPEYRNNAYEANAKVLASSLLINQGKQGFLLKPLPNEAQFAPVFGVISEDFNLDGNLDLLLVGNQYGFEIETGRGDAFRGLLLNGDGKLSFFPQSINQSGFRVPGEAKALALVSLANGNFSVVSSQNSDNLKSFKVLSQTDNQYNFTTSTSSCKFQWSKAKSRKVERYWGSGYLSQSSSRIFFHAKPATIKQNEPN